MAESDDSTGRLMSSAVKYIVGGLATLLVSALLTFLRHFAAPVYDAITTSVSKAALVQMLYILLLTCVLLVAWIVLLKRERRKPLADGYDFDEYGGFYLDPKSGRAICPSCSSEGKVVHMMDIEGNKMCNACHTTCRGKAKTLDGQQTPGNLR